MNEKEFVLVSQGIEIYRTKSQENAVNMVKKENDEYFDYLKKCYDNYERPADNYINLEIEYSSEKEKDKEIERLNSIIKEVREYITNKYDYLLCDDTLLDHDERIDRKQIKHILEILDKENNNANN